MANNLQSIQLNPNLIVCPGPANQLNANTDEENSNKNLRHASLLSKPDNDHKMQANNGITK